MSSAAMEKMAIPITEAMTYPSMRWMRDTGGGAGAAIGFLLATRQEYGVCNSHRSTPYSYTRTVNCSV
jgi:hypothetical protein